MKAMEYYASVLQDGHLSLPEEADLKPGELVRVIILTDEKKGKLALRENMKKTKPAGLEVEKRGKLGSEFCGLWEDERSAEDIIKDIYSHRTGFGDRKVPL